MKSIIRLTSTAIRRLNQNISTEKILVLGDSHVSVFHSYYFILNFPFKYFKVVSVGGATASGLENPRSKTQAFKIFNEALEKKDYDKIIIMLGEVDTGFVIWYRAKKYNTDVEEMFNKTVETYTKFIKKSSEYADTIVISTPLPTISDNAVGEVAHARREVKASQKERTELTLKFNSTIENFCKKNSIKYINLDNQSLGEDGLVKDCLKNPDPKDHHYDNKKYSKMIIKNLKAYLNE